MENCEGPRQMEDLPSCSCTKRKIWPPGLPQKGKKEPCLRLGSPETESEPKIYLQEIYQGKFSGTTPVRKWGKQDWIEREVASEASTNHTECSGMGLAHQSCPEWEKKARSLYPSSVDVCCPWAESITSSR